MERNKGAKIYFEASAIGLFRAVAGYIFLFNFFFNLKGMPLEHPFDSIKSRMQSEINRKVSFLGVSSLIFSPFLL